MAKWLSYLLLFSCSVVSDSLWPHGLEHARLPCPLLSPGVFSNSHPLSRWCHPTISISATLFSSCPQFFPALGSFSNELALRNRWLKYCSFSVSPSNECSELISFRIDWFDLLAVQGLTRVLSSTTVQKHQFFGAQPFLRSNSHQYMITGKTIPLTIWTFVSKVMSAF